MLTPHCFGIFSTKPSNFTSHNSAACAEDYFATFRDCHCHFQKWCFENLYTLYFNLIQTADSVPLLALEQFKGEKYDD